MSVQPSLNNSNTVVAEIINEINSTQPSGNYSQNTRSTPIQPQMQQQMQQQRAPQQQQQRAPPQQHIQQPMTSQRATPIRRPTQPPTQPQQKKATPIRRPSRSSSNSFMKQQQQMRRKKQNKKVRFKEEVEEKFIGEDTDSDAESNESVEMVMKKSKHYKHSKKLTKPKFLKKDEVESSDLTETKGLYSKVIGFFTKDTKEPLLVLALVFAISMPIVNKLMARFLPFIMKNGEGSMLVVGVKALVVALVFFAIKKLLL